MVERKMEYCNNHQSQFSFGRYQTRVEEAEKKGKRVEMWRNIGEVASYILLTVMMISGVWIAFAIL